MTAKFPRRDLLQVGMLGAATATTASILANEEKSPNASSSATRVTPFLTFIGKAEEAMNRYITLFDDSKIVSIERYRAGDTGKEGTVKIAEFSIGNQRFFCIDSPDVHAWSFSPAVSMFVENSDEALITKYFEELSKQGKVYMPLGEYPFSEKFAWVEDEFGVSWQLSTTSI